MFDVFPAFCGYPQVSVGLDVLADVSGYHCLTDDGEQRLFCFVRSDAEVLQLVVVVRHDGGGAVAVKQIHDMFGAELLIELQDGLNSDA